MGDDAILETLKNRVSFGALKNPVRLGGFSNKGELYKFAEKVDETDIKFAIVGELPNIEIFAQEEELERLAKIGVKPQLIEV
jgi:hypothetical protein